MIDVEAQDFEFEEELKTHPYNVKKWLRYIQSKMHKDFAIRYTLYERALNYMPRSYKLWYKYLMERIRECKPLCIADRRVLETNNAFERALTFMHKYPRIWMMYGEFLTWQRFVTKTRKSFDRALMSLPLTQHDRIWPLYLKFCKAIKVPETAMRVYRRYVKLNPEAMEEYVDFMEKQGQWDEAANRLAWMVNNESFVSKKKQTKIQLWKRLCNLMCEHATKIKSLDVNAIIRSGISRYPQEVGYLWNLLAQYFMRCSLFEKAVDVYEEAINSVATVRDFTIVYQAYSEFLQVLIDMKMRDAGDTNFDEEDDDDEALFDISSPCDVDLMLDRLDHLTSRRDVLLSSVKLRQNPHNIKEWLKRVQIFVKREQINEANEQFAAALNTVDPYKATGRYSTLWVAYAKFFIDHDEDGLSNARDVFRMATKKEFRGVDELATIWCEWAELELRHHNYDKALEILREGAQFPTPEQRSSDKVQDRLWKSTKLWCFRADLEESLGSLDEIRECYDDMIKLQVATVHNILNYADKLWISKHFEDSFRAYERGIGIFDHPHVMVIWMTYLNKFLIRYKDSRLERARELFEQALDSCPQGPSKKLYLMFARLEEERGLARHAMRIYDEACEKVENQDKPEMYRIYIKRATDLFGVTRSRQIFEKALQNLPDSVLPDFALRYVKLETALGEIDRGRALFIYGSQYADPGRHSSYWKSWQDFEMEYGNEETYQELLRMKRSVEALSTNSRMTGFVSGGIVGKKRTSEEAGMDAIEKLEANQKIEEEIEEDRMDEDVQIVEGEEEMESEKLEKVPDIETHEVPKAVFGAGMSAMDRFLKDRDKIKI